MIKYIIVISAILISITGLYAMHDTKIIPYAVAQQEDNKTIIDGVEVPSQAQAQSGVDYYHKVQLSALLHNASNYNILNAQASVYSCLVSLVSMPQDGAAVGICDNSMTYAIVNHELGNNQTIIQLAHTYLKARGIQ